MSATSIEWATTVWNPVSGCTKVSAGCAHCYAETLSKRFWGKRKFTDVQCHEDRLEQPLHWRTPRKVFVNSMSDLFHEKVPWEFIDRIFAVMALCPQHTFMVLTKRPKRMAEYVCDGRTWAIRNTALNQGLVASRSEVSVPWPLSNLWLGVSCEDQATADERIPPLLKCPAAVRFVSAEPLLGPITFHVDCGTLESIGRPTKRVVYQTLEKYEGHPGVDWVIAGGESGPGARPCNVEWIRSIVDQCKAVGTACFVKQIGSRPYDPAWHGDGTPEGSRMRPNSPKGGDPAEWTEELCVRQWPEENEK